MPIVLKSGSQILQENSGHVQACNTFALPLISFENTVLTFCWTDWLRTILCTSAWMDRYPADFRAAQLRCRGETRNCLSQRWRLHILKWRDIWKLVYSHSGVCEVSLSLRYDTKLPDCLFLKCWDKLVVWKRREKITQWHCVISQKNRIFMYLFIKREFWR